METPYGITNSSGSSITKQAGDNVNRQAYPFCPCQALQDKRYMMASKSGSRDSIVHLISKSINPSISIHLDKFYCQKCFRVALQDYYHNRDEAVQERDRLRMWCAESINRIRTRYCKQPPLDYSSADNPNDPSHHQEYSGVAQKIGEYQDTVAQLKRRLSTLQSVSNVTAMTLARMSCRNEERAFSIQKRRIAVATANDGLEQLYSAIIGPGCKVNSNCAMEGQNSSMEVNTELLSSCSGLVGLFRREVKQAKKIRFQLALKSFQMHRIDVGEEYSHITSLSMLLHEEESDQDNYSIDYAKVNRGDEWNVTAVKGSKRHERLLRNKIPYGVGKIGGLPLPHAGPVLYGVLPSESLRSSLRLVASLTKLLAKCLGILLPHPILLQPLSGNSNMMRETCDIVFHCVADEIDPHCREKHCDIVTMDDVNRLGLGVDHTFHESNIQESNEKTASIQSVLTTVDAKPTSLRKTQLSSSQLSNTATSTLHAITSSTSSLISLMKSSSHKISRSAHKALDKMTGHGNFGKEGRGHGQVFSDYVSPAMDDASVKERLSFSFSANICETYGSASSTGSNPASTRSTSSLYSSADVSQHKLPSSKSVASYALNPPQCTNLTVGNNNRDAQIRREEKFLVGLELLQNDVLSLCIHSGVPIGALWPKEALLLNLYSLMLFCQQEVNL